MTDLAIIFEDDYLMVIDKPPGLVVTPADSNKQLSLAEILQQDKKITIERGGVVHRLDKDTSGLLIIAKTIESLEYLQLQFKERQVKKQYVALVHGKLDKEQVVEGSIDRNPKNREKFVVIDGGKEASTRFVPEAHYLFSESIKDQQFLGMNKNQLRKLERSNYGIFTLVNCFPLTGRTHQIRVHLKHIGFPIVGDEKYAGRKTARLDTRWCPRQFLHAKSITFYHPATGQKISFESPLPADLTEVLTKLHKTNG